MGYMDVETSGYEVHARKRSEGAIIFRIWDGETDCYITEEMTDALDVRQKLLELEVARFQEKMQKAVVGRVANARRNGFESPFATSGELTDPWKEEGRHIVRGI